LKIDEEEEVIRQTFKLADTSPSEFWLNPPSVLDGEMVKMQSGGGRTSNRAIPWILKKTVVMVFWEWAVGRVM
jgi:hypothetical protein